MARPAYRLPDRPAPAVASHPGTRRCATPPCRRHRRTNPSERPRRGRWARPGRDVQAHRITALALSVVGPARHLCPDRCFVRRRPARRSGLCVLGHDGFGGGECWSARVGFGSCRHLMTGGPAREPVDHQAIAMGRQHRAHRETDPSLGRRPSALVAAVFTAGSSVAENTRSMELGPAHGHLGMARRNDWVHFIECDGAQAGVPPAPCRWNGDVSAQCPDPDAESRFKSDASTSSSGRTGAAASRTRVSSSGCGICCRPTRCALTAGRTGGSRSTRSAPSWVGRCGSQRSSRSGRWRGG